MQISSSYSVSTVPYDIRYKQDNVPQFSAERAVKESENINRYMPEADFDEKAFDMIGPNARKNMIKTLANASDDDIQTFDRLGSQYVSLMNGAEKEKD